MLRVTKAADVHPRVLSPVRKASETARWSCGIYPGPMWDICWVKVCHFWVKVCHVWGTKIAKKLIIFPKMRFSSKRKKMWDIWDMALKRDE
jgi:hypothetical protein